MGAIRLYQLTLSRALAKLPPGVISCKFEPSCSHYGFEAIRAHGPLKGCLLAAWRVMRCSSLTDGGHDPVPTPFKLPPLKRRYD
ncbi:MAG: membrane protein insertion efficiency factor YidD [Deltaproteobacteria bacterium]|nr:membrane protein insertion efficiency factor YidD [Deltaproteobacteria bacterium]